MDRASADDPGQRAGASSAAFGVRVLPVGTFEEPAHLVYWQARDPDLVQLRPQVFLLQGGGTCALVNTPLPNDLTGLRFSGTNDVG